MKKDNITATQGLTSLFVGQSDVDSTEKKVELIKTKLREFFNLKNVNFLLGAGTSNGAIDTMSELYKHLEFSKDGKNEEKEFKSIVAKEGENLEKILKVMYSARNYYNGIQDDDKNAEDDITHYKELYDRLIKKIEGHIFDSINVDFATKECPLPGNYFEIEEFPSSDLTSDKACLIYPTPTKQDKSLGAPYVDLFREFQNKLLEPHSVLFIIGYGFNDRHVNDIIYRALATNSTINVVIFSSKPKDNERKKKPIFFIDDNRIFTFSGKVWDVDDDEKEVADTRRTINHFDYIVNELLPNLDAFKMEDNLVQGFVNQLNKLTKDRK